MNKKTHSFFLLLIVNCLLFITPKVSAQSVMSSDVYKMQSDSINFAGVPSSSTNYQIAPTAGEAASGQTDSTNYTGYLGFQFMGFADPDTEDPTAPTSLTAQVVSSSEIELSWSASTDNVGVDRYYIYRDGVRIDDVTSFPRDFNDTGLTASTLYSYSVSAVDDSLNESLWSSTTTATTLSGSSSITTGGARSVIVSNFLIASNADSAGVSFLTSLPRSAEIYWGRDLNYADGVAKGLMTQDHSFVLNNLVPQTFYHIKLVLKDEYGSARSFENISFRTLNVSLSAQPVNVYSFNSKEQGGAINLDWRMPIDPRVVGVKILRSDISYPATPEEGKLIFAYSGRDAQTQFNDTDVVAGKRYFYTLFTEDLAGNLSSGMVTSIRFDVSSEGVVSVDRSNPLDGLVRAKEVDPKIAKLELNDFLFIQSGDSVDISNNRISIQGDKNLTVALKYFRLPPVLKTIAVTLLTKEDEPRSFTFILRPNREKTRYEAVIGSLGNEFNYKIRIDIIDYKNQGLKTLSGELLVGSPAPKAYKFPINNKVISIAFGVFGLLAISIFGLIKFRRKNKLPLIDTTSALSTK